MPAVLFVCLGNICRSPAAEGILRNLAKIKEVKDLHIASCGLGCWHAGQLPDIRMRDVAKKRGIFLTSRAQVFKSDFFDQFDYILAADHEVRNTLFQHAKIAEHQNKIHLITTFSACYHNQDIPDPYYEEDAIFELVLDMLEDSCLGLLDDLKKHTTRSN